MAAALFLPQIVGPKPGFRYNRRAAVIDMTRKTRKITRKTKNNSFAIAADAPATPVNPSAPAMMAMIAKMIAHFSMTNTPCL